MGFVNIPWNDGSNESITLTFEDNKDDQVVTVTSPINLTQNDRTKIFHIGKVGSSSYSGTITVTQPVNGIGQMIINSTFVVYNSN